MQSGDCVKTPDGRIGRVREIKSGKVRVRVKRTASHTHQFLWFGKSQLKVVTCPAGWMSPEGYKRYLKVTLEKMRKRLGK